MGVGALWNVEGRDALQFWLAVIGLVDDALLCDGRSRCDGMHGFAYVRPTSDIGLTEASCPTH